MKIGNSNSKLEVAIAGHRGAFFPSAQIGNVVIRKFGSENVFFSLNNIANDGKHKFVFGDNKNLNTFSILNNGKVGVGTTNPLEKLHINGSVRGNIGTGALRIKSSSGYINVGALNTSWAHIYTDRPNVIFNKDVYTTTSSFSSYRNDLILKTDGSEKMRIKISNGYVGIGTTKPDEKLTVKGKIHAEEVRVDLNVPPDFVFEKYYTGKSSTNPNYTIPTLEEVEIFTKRNHHLSEVPSAKEIKENGLNLKEMTSLLLQKIEELTIYTIQQQKTINRLEKEVKSLKNKN